MRVRSPGSMLDGRDDDPARLERASRAALARVPAAQPFVLVLDDAQALRGEGARECLPDSPPTSAAAAMLALAARGEPPLPVARLRAQAAARRARRPPPRDDARGDRRAPGARRPPALGRELDALVQLTEGWPAGLSLALLALADGRRRRT